MTHPDVHKRLLVKQLYYTLKRIDDDLPHDQAGGYGFDSGAEHESKE